MKSRQRKNLRRQGAIERIEPTIEKHGGIDESKIEAG